MILIVPRIRATVKGFSVSQPSFPQVLFVKKAVWKDSRYGIMFGESQKHQIKYQLLQHKQKSLGGVEDEKRNKKKASTF